MKRVLTARALVGRFAVIVLVGAVAASVAIAPVSFEPASNGLKVAHAGGQKHKPKKHKHRHQQSHHELYNPGGGPPPWAPAHGYRRKHGTREVSYVPPFDINLGNCNREQIGSLLGGAAGGLLGSNIGKGSGQTAAIIGGTILGVLIGGSVGRSMDQLDQNCVGQILEHAPGQHAVEWQNPDTGVTYEVTPTQTHQDNQGRYCREYQATATVGGRAQQTYGTACRQPDGSWQLVS